ncbi:unnamed protein product [Acanthoscelides obtectus]|uniref:Uncharacterized protein n=1 Tax=Acanthoscelides obtectus TaxID=200917 RepID=A0A9P0KFY5_ACAOB|nr:unnamed protein product [Acanthoscelides obtectus]CAK1647614.1 hypothetical protein AOBTE_LOCUS15295 [Acanthoscelides obtectus]
MSTVKEICAPPDSFHLEDIESGMIRAGLTSESSNMSSLQRSHMTGNTQFNAKQAQVVCDHKRKIRDIFVGYPVECFGHHHYLEHFKKMWKPLYYCRQWLPVYAFHVNLLLEKRLVLALMPSQDVHSISERFAETAAESAESFSPAKSNSRTPCLNLKFLSQPLLALKDE